MKYLKTFEGMESPYDKYIDYLTSFIDDRFTITWANYFCTCIIIKPNYTRGQIYNNRGRDILGVFDTNEVNITNRKPGLIYSKSRKSEETLELVEMLTDTVLKITNFTDQKEGYFILDDVDIRIYLTKYDTDYN